MSEPNHTHLRALNAQIDLSDVAPSFVLGADHKSYRHQFANLYYARLTYLKPLVEQKAKEKWADIKGEQHRVKRFVSSSRRLAGSPPLVPRVLDVERSQLCFIVGTVYMDMPQKPNVLEDVGRDVSVHFMQLARFPH